MKYILLPAFGALIGYMLIMRADKQVSVETQATADRLCAPFSAVYEHDGWSCLEVM